MKLMKEKYEHHKYIKRNLKIQRHKRLKKVPNRGGLNHFVNGIEKYKSDKSNEDLVNDIFSEIDKSEIDKQENNVVPMNAMNAMNSENMTKSKYGKYDNKFEKEIKNDYVNNNLMARMNGELDLRKSKRKKKMFILPYTNITGIKYAPYNNNNNNNNNMLTNFSSIKNKEKYK